MKYGIHICFIVWLTVGLTSVSLAKQDTGIVHDSLVAYQKAIYNRPFIGLGSTGISLGGYAEGNTNYFVEDGLTEGFSMEMRRVNLFVYSPIGKRLKYLMELEFEHGTEEIALETAQIDFEKGIREIRDYLKNEGIKEIAKEEIRFIVVGASQFKFSLSV